MSLVLTRARGGPNRPAFRRIWRCAVFFGAWAFNAVAVPDAMARVARALGRDTAAGGLYDLLAELDVPNSLAAVGMPANGLDRAAALATANPYWNPRSVDAAAVRAPLDDAWVGRRPG